MRKIDITSQEDVTPHCTPVGLEQRFSFYPRLPIKQLPLLPLTKISLCAQENSHFSILQDKILWQCNKHQEIKSPFHDSIYNLDFFIYYSQRKII